MKERDGCFIEIVVATIVIFWLFIDCDKFYIYITLLTLFFIYFVTLIISDYRSKKEEERLTAEITELSKQKELLDVELLRVKRQLYHQNEVVDVKRQIEEYINDLPKAIKDLPHLYSDIKMVYLKRDYEQGLNQGRWGYKTKEDLVERISKAEKNTQLLRALLYKLDILLLEIEECAPVGKKLKLIIDEVDFKRESMWTILKEVNDQKRELNAIKRNIENKKDAFNIISQKCKDLEQEHASLSLENLKLEKRIAALQEENNVLENAAKVRMLQEKEEAERCIKAVEEFAESKMNYILAQGENHAVLSKMAEEWAEFNRAAWDYVIVYLLNKKRPIRIETATEFRSKLKEYKEELFMKYKETQYKYNYLLAMFPELQEYIDGEAVQELSSEVPEELDDKRQYYIPKEEWGTLNESQKSQLALDRYNERRRLTNAQVGRDYEEYIAFLFRNRCRGAEIMMYGEQKGLADLGRDLIVKYKGKVYIVQCKRWSQEKVIREKHIMQLFGTTIEYCWEMKNKDIHPLDVVGKSVIPVFVTTTELSPTANRFAERLGVIVHKVPMGDYPQIKCNIGKEGERIYHLPFDQQYNSTLIEHNKGEFMAWTVEEAEKNGFRRALRHYIS